MPVKKKTNYISYDLGRLETYIKQLEHFLDTHPPDSYVDRIEEIPTSRGSIYKVVASIEQQLKSFMDALEKLPRLLADINTLRMQVDHGKELIEIRGGYKKPGFMEDDDEDEDDEDEKPKVKKKIVKSKKAIQQDNNKDKFDDDSFYIETIPKELPISSIKDEFSNEKEIINDPQDDDSEWYED